MPALARRMLVACLLACALGRAWATPPEVTSAWSRATAPGQTTGAVYMTLTSGTADRLTAISSPNAASAMLHQTSQMGGMSSMQAMDGLDLPAGKPVTLAPHGMHVMLEGLKAPLVAGGYVTLTLTFGHAGAATFNVPVVPVGASGPGRIHE